MGIVAQLGILLLSAAILLTGNGLQTTLLPLAAGTALGIALRVRIHHPTARPLSRIEWTTTFVVLLALGAMALFMARPASTEPIIGPDGQPVEGSVAELTTVEVDGHDLALMIRGRSVDNPVLLYLAGGPGGTDLGASAPIMRTQIGVSYLMASGWQVGAAFNHKSNGGTATNNPGVETLLLTFGRGF